MKRLALPGCLLLVGCMVGPDYQRPEMTAPDRYHADVSYSQVDGQPLYNMEWVEIFRDEELRGIIEQALSNNRDMLAAVERIEEARAESRIARSALYPTLDLDLNAEREDESKRTNSDPEQQDTVFTGLSAGWEIDLWGRNRRARNAAFARYLAAEYGAQAVRLSLIAEVSRAYFSLQATQAQLQINRDTLEAREKALDISRKRFAGGLTSKLEVMQSEVEYAQTRAIIPVFEQSRLAFENQLALLLGEPPTHRTIAARLREQYVPASVTAGLPSTLLRRRPDVLRTEQELRAASEAVGVATAGLFPDIRLTGALGYESEDFDDMLDGDAEYWVVNLDLVMPLFNAGARRAGLTAAESRFNQARLAYEQTVLEALQEVSEALNRFYKSGEALNARLDLERASAEYLSLATKRWRNGVLAYIHVLDAQRLLFDAQIDVARARQDQLTALVDLYMALGGGWDPEAFGALAAGVQ